MAEVPPNDLETSSADKAVFDNTGEDWKGTQENLLKNYETIIALRGAGTNNGIDREAVTGVIAKLVERIKQKLEKGPVALVFDGDGEDLAKPDIGYIMGRLAEAFKDEPKDRVVFVAAQKKSWYDYAPGASEGRKLGNATGQEYETTVFPDGQFAGEHNSFTQSTELANSDKYEQWYVGASGPIAFEQLQDLNGKISDGKRNILMVPVQNNSELSDSFTLKLEQAQAELSTAEASGDTTVIEKAKAKVKKFEDVIAQRQKPYGVHYNEAGELNINTNEYENLSFEVLR